MVDIPFDWLDQTDRAYRLERGHDRFIAMMQHHHDQSLEIEMSRIIDEVCAKYGVQSDNEPIDPSHSQAIFGEIAARIGAYAAHLPYEQTLTPQEILRLLTDKTA